MEPEMITTVALISPYTRIRLLCTQSPFLQAYDDGLRVRELRENQQGLSHSSSDSDITDDDKFCVDVDFLRSLDPKEWKDQDHYAVLGLKKLRFNATDDDIKRAYRKIVLIHHPDKRKAKGEEVRQDDDYFTCITRAYEILGTPLKRRSYDSVDPDFDDNLPTQSEIEKDFFRTMDKYFTLNSRWSERKNVPNIGVTTADRDYVDNFYNFWYNFESWREYSYLDEEDKERGQDRDERRWIEKQNKAIRAKRKKEEMSRIRALVDLAYNNDPRIGRFKQEEKEKRMVAKRAKQDAIQAQKAEEERLIREAALAKVKAEEEEQKRIEGIRLEREQQKKALKKERKTLRDLAKSNNYYADGDDKIRVKNMEGVEKICELMKAMELQEFNRELQAGGQEVFLRVLQETEVKLEEERRAMFQKNTPSSTLNTALKMVDKNTMWSPENMQILIKAVNLFPAGTAQRWDVIANFMNMHSPTATSYKYTSRDVLNKAKDLQSGDFSKSVLKAQANDNAFESFEKNKKELKVVDKAEISVKDGEASDAKKTPEVNGSADKEPKTWTKEEQALLEQAIKTYPISTPERWDRIAECIPNRTKKECLKRVKELVDRVIYSSLYEVVVDFTRDYDVIRKALGKVDHYDKTCLENVLHAINSILLSNWGVQSHCQIIVFTDCGLGFGSTSLTNVIQRIITTKQPLPFGPPSKLNFVCLGNQQENQFAEATKVYQNLLDMSGQKGQLFIPKIQDTIEYVKIKKEDKYSTSSGNDDDVVKVEIPTSAGLSRLNIKETIERLCDLNFRPFEAILNCGSYFKLECPVLVWPPPLPQTSVDMLGIETTRNISRRIEVCGFISISDIGSPMSTSRHLLMPKREERKGGEKRKSSGETDYERLEVEIKNFYAKGETASDDEVAGSSGGNESTRESICVLLHGALKIENMAALVLLGDNWFGFIYSYADSKKKSNMMLTVLPQGSDVVPWLGDLRLLGTVEDLLPGETLSQFPVKPDKRSYSQNCVVWIKQSGIQSDVQKVLRHAKKLPEKTQHFYKELNRIRRAALSLGFVELLEGLACIFEREIPMLPPNASPDCALQLKHAAMELKKFNLSRDLKHSIIPYPTKYNQ
ncbi:DnaJ homolog subfamily C member 2 [Sergentomyia squamirostris]